MARGVKRCLCLDLAGAQRQGNATVRAKYFFQKEKALNLARLSKENVLDKDTMLPVWAEGEVPWLPGGHLREGESGCVMLLKRQLKTRRLL